MEQFLAIDNSADTPRNPSTYFNLHKLYPEQFEADDLCGFKAWDYDWMIEHTGCKWNPSICLLEEKEGVTLLGFNSAWSPPNDLLERMHQLTSWTIHNAFEEEQPDYVGSVHFEGGAWTWTMREGYPKCASCETRVLYSQLDAVRGECQNCQDANVRE